jgi:hypothetical protein
MAVDGVWNVTMKSPMGNDTGTLELHADGGSLTGRLASSQGSLDIAEGTVDGAKVAFTAQVESPMKMTLKFAATVDGDAIRGSMKFGVLGKASFTGTRAAPAAD